MLAFIPFLYYAMKYSNQISATTLW
jgi:hypothetical protein